MKCPKCGHEWPAENQRAGGKARWHGTTKKQRSEAARKAVKARWAKRPNKKVSDGLGNAATTTP